MKSPRYTWLLRLWLRLNGWRLCPTTGYWNKRVRGGASYLTSAEGAVGIELRKDSAS
jgi:hypothetical protein